MRSIVALVVAASFAAVPATPAAAYTISTAKDLYDICLTEQEDPAEDAATYMFCTGYIRASFELLFAQDVREGGNPAECLEGDRSNHDLVDDVLVYFRSHPAGGDTLASDAVFTALLETPAGCFLRD